MICCQQQLLSPVKVQNPDMEEGSESASGGHSDISHARMTFQWMLRPGFHLMASSAPQRIRERVMRGLGPFSPVSTQNLSAWVHQHRNLVINGPNQLLNPARLGTDSPSRPEHIIDMESPRLQDTVNTNAGGNVAINSMHYTETFTGPSRESNANRTSEDATSALRNSSELRALLSLAEKYVPFLLILLLKLVFDHRIGILVIIGLFVTFCHSNAVVKREVGKQSKRHLSSLLIIAANLVMCIGFVYFVLAEASLAYALVFIPPYDTPVTLWEVLWIVTVTDLVIKLVTIFVKAIIIVLPMQVLAYKKKGKHYLFVEMTSQLYRSLAPMQHWLYYFSESYQGSGKVFGVILSATFLVSKCADLVNKTRAWKRAFGTLLQSMTYGVTPSMDQVKAAGETCPICQDDYRSPTLLQCKHVFCEECVSLWFDRERTCPVCRAQIADDPTWKDGSTTFLVQLF